MYFESSARIFFARGPGRGRLTLGSVAFANSFPASAFSCVFKLNSLRHEPVTDPIRFGEISPTPGLKTLLDTPGDFRIEEFLPLAHHAKDLIDFI